MAYFSVVMNGEGISVSSSDPDNDIVGFYTTRWVKAQNVEDAKQLAIGLVARDWTEGEYAGLVSESPPRITIEEINEVSLFTYLRRRLGRGHTFYSSDD